MEALWESKFPLNLRRKPLLGEGQDSQDFPVPEVGGDTPQGPHPRRQFPEGEG